VNATKIDEIVKAAEGCELIVNGLPPEFNMRVMDAAIAVGASYQDMAAGNDEQGFVAAVQAQLDRDAEFADAGLTALLTCGSAPGIANLIAREAVDKFDRVETIDFLVYEGVWTTHFIPFWWSPETAFDDMVSRPVVYRNGEHILVPPFNDPAWVDFPGVGRRRMYDHHHEEPVTMGLLADRYLKGAKNINFRTSRGDGQVVFRNGAAVTRTGRCERPARGSLRPGRRVGATCTQVPRRNQAGDRGWYRSRRRGFSGPSRW
jgi:saccharopine dehydrogenase-like NADP-dependent oxidoreductase